MEILVAVAIILIPLAGLAALVAWIRRVLELDNGSMRLPQRPKPLPR